MKKIFLIIGLCGLSMACAEKGPLPPITNNSSYGNGSAYAEQTSSNKAKLEMLGRVESLQTDIQQLRGLVEQQAHEISNLKNRQQKVYVDIDERLQQLEPTTHTSNNISERESLAAPVVETDATTYAGKTQIEESRAGEKAAFDKAFASVKNSQYPQAVKLFNQFLLEYPAGEYSDNATFWLASVYKVVDDLPLAKTTFQAVYTQFPKSEKAGLAMLKLADIYLEENNQLKAKQLYTQITTQYANTSAAHMAAMKLQNTGL